MNRLACWSIVVMLVFSPWYEVSPSAQVATEIGTWTLDLAQSTFPGGSGPRSRTLTIENFGQGVKVSNLTVAADGRVTSGSYTEIYDGRNTRWPTVQTPSLRHPGASTRTLGSASPKQPAR